MPHHTKRMCTCDSQHQSFCPNLSRSSSRVTCLKTETIGFTFSVFLTVASQKGEIFSPLQDWWGQYSKWEDAEGIQASSPGCPLPPDKTPTSTLGMPKCITVYGGNGRRFQANFWSILVIRLENLSCRRKESLHQKVKWKDLTLLWVYSSIL
jgi:hypothetical protein